MKYLLVLAAFLASSVSAVETTSSDGRVYSGDYFYNFENAYLTPDGKPNESWCLSGNVSMAKAELPTKGSAPPWGTSHVVVRGKLGPEGHFGSLGGCNRVLTITQLLKVSNMRGQDGTSP
jgi:hypothetical protein